MASNTSAWGRLGSPESYTGRSTWGAKGTGSSSESETIGATPLLDAAPWLRSALNELDNFSNLGENWDSYSSAPISAVALSAARLLLSSIKNDTAPAPSLAPVSGGGISIEWDAEFRELEIQVLPDGAIQMLKVTGRTDLSAPDAMQELHIRKADAVPINGLLSWLVRGELDR